MPDPSGQSGPPKDRPWWRLRRRDVVTLVLVYVVSLLISFPIMAWFEAHR